MATLLVRVLVSLLAGIAALYLVGMNLFLRTHLFRDAIGFDPNMLLVDYTSAYSVWPGSIHAQGLSIRGRDGNVEWILRIDRCSFQVSFTDLIRKKFHANHVRGDGLSFRLRLRVDEVTAETLSALPPIAGFDYPPLRDVGPEDPPLTDATYKLWSIELDDVVATHVREIWIHTVRSSGELEIRGRWVFRPMRWLDVGPATIDARSLEVSFGAVEPWASGVVGRLQVTIHPFGIDKTPAADIVDEVSVHGDLSGTAWGASVMNRALPVRGLYVTHATVPFQLHAHVDHGVLRAGTHLLTEAFDARISAAGVAFGASLRADVQVDPDGAGYADLRVVDAQASTESRRLARVARIAATFVSRDLDLARAPFSAPLYAIEVDGAETDSLGDWRSRVSALRELDVTSGPVTVSGRLEGAVRDQTGKGHVALSMRELTLTHGDEHVHGDVTGTLHLDGSLVEKRVTMSGSELSLRDVRAVLSGASLRADSVDIHAPGLLLARSAVAGHVTFDARALAVARGDAQVLAATAVVHVDGSVASHQAQLSGSEVTLRGLHATLKGVAFDAPSLAARIVRLGVGETGLVGRIAVDAPLVEVPSLVGLGALLPLPADIAIEGGRGTASLALVVDVSKGVATGRIALAARDLRLKVAAEQMQGDLTIALRANDNGAITDLSGSEVDFRHVGDAGPTPGWWGHARLRQATLALRPRVRFRSYVTATGRDGSPLTALVADNTALPPWLLGLVSTKGLEATGELLVTPSVFALRSVEADAEGARLGFELGKVGEAHEWALLLDLGVILAGVDVANAQTQVLLFGGARPWFKAKVAALELLERRSE